MVLRLPDNTGGRLLVDSLGRSGLLAVCPGNGELRPPELNSSVAHQDTQLLLSMGLTAD
jgi:hypothetical protein